MSPSRRGEIDPLDYRAARVAALDALGRRDHASEALRRKLVDKGYDVHLVADVIERLRTERLVDDRRYVDNFIAYHAARGQGPLRVRAELRRLGLEGALVEEAIDGFREWIAHLRQARQKKFGSSLPTDSIERHRQIRFLGGRGFTGAQIRLALGFDNDLDHELDRDDVNPS